MWQSVSVGVLFYVMSLSIGKAGLPLGHGLVCDMEPVRQFLLGQVLLFSQLGHKGPEAYVVHGVTSLTDGYYEHFHPKKQPTKSREVVFD